ncbi:MULTISPECIES: glycosyltransferase [Pseudidiomarina]|uniref:1,2-diacylglycerol 3-glucosyltransferase n=2 Tax=Pseudidiomarina TaxID=2800384 RepID=A0A368UPC2_9GAMM|nr:MULTISPECIES: glycosyltransferase [Pseudidiomarina]PWW11362.1 1,2-diacylglycerol 3-glucosyltransferase [Pseudidiomarina maritima]RBP88846.1 1,2-diacylglycerol 3-glucosyltransferase [Pseudidiomarina tainanensis]RCW30678.1 1,2-diacylglycerol 3-glucosyltransferase [Pseudidiomarina tainanensis]
MVRKYARWLYRACFTVIILLVFYKVYLNFFEKDFIAEHAVQVEQIESILNSKDEFRFAVVGNISNSVGIFERKIIPLLNEQGYDFVISAGNAVSTGGEDKYRAIYRTLSRLNMPYLLTFGPQEESRLGGFRFYDHFGPLHFSFKSGNNRFLFIDSTGTTDFSWQYRWLKDELTSSQEDNLFLFSAHPFYSSGKKSVFDLSENTFEKSYQRRFSSLIEEFGVDVVFSSISPVFDKQIHSDTTFITTGGAGGFVINDEKSHYHFVSVTVKDSRIEVLERPLEVGQHPILRTVESAWFFLHSLFYVGYLNFLLLVSIFVVIAYWLHERVLSDRDYYPSYDIDWECRSNKPLRIVHFTNNYLPFIGGVPLSVERLRNGLNKLGHQILIVAPSYPGKMDNDDNGIFRVSSLIPFGRHSEFRVANILSLKLYREVIRFKPDIIHVHHPFWLGRAGLYLAKFLKIPVVYTYHTRLEHYAHYVPLPSSVFRNLIAHSLIRRFANQCDGVIVPTECAQEYLRTIGVKRRILVQPTGIDIAQTSDLSVHKLDDLKRKYTEPNERILISISRLSREKNIDFLLAGVELLKSKYKQPFHLLVIGDGPDKQRIQSEISRKKLQSHISLMGSVNPEDIPLFCQLGEIFLFASMSETQGMVILEAMAGGMPVVAVRSSGIDDIVENGKNGYKTIYDVDLWSDRVYQLLTNQELLETTSFGATITARKYSIEHFSQNISRFYTAIQSNHLSKSSRQ